MNRCQLIGSEWIIEIFPMDDNRIGFYQVILGGNWKIEGSDRMYWWDGDILCPEEYGCFMDLIEWKPWKIDT